MSQLLTLLPPNTRALLIVAAPAEARAALAAFNRQDEQIAPWQPEPLAPHLELLLTGVGKANAAAALAYAFNPAHHAIAINLGVAGMLPGSGLALAHSVLAEHSIYADEGGITPQGFVDIAEMGFPPELMVGVDATVAKQTPPNLLAALKPLADHIADIATVSTCSGTDDAAWLVKQRTAAAAEAMEGAALAFTAAPLTREDTTPLPFAELRIISNPTGDRDTQRWNIKDALTRLTDLTALL